MSIAIDSLSSLVLVVGLSGAGKSSASNALADLGYHSIDGLPVELLPQLLEFTKSNSERFAKTCLLITLDSAEEVQGFLELYRSLKGPKTLLIYLDSDPQIIIRRYSETRRPHPGFQSETDKTLLDAIERERSILTPIRELATSVISTSELSPHDLKRELRSLVDSFLHDANKHVRVNFVSFGFKYGIPRDCDLVVDVRFLPNPYFVEGMRELTGLDPGVKKFVLENPKSIEFLKRYSDLLQFLLPQYAFEGKSYVNIGVGCTGGRHRSTAIVEHLAQSIDPDLFLVTCKHRDIER